MTTERPSHPAKDQLIAFGQGKLAAGESSQVESHLEVCRECCETLLDLKDDTFVGLVKIAQSSDSDRRMGTLARPDLESGTTESDKTKSDKTGTGMSAHPTDSEHSATLLVQSGEAVSVGLVGGALLALAGAGGLALVSLSLAAAAAGFLVFNWPPAKIFMGDVGSGLLGYAFGVLALASERAGAVPLLVWMLLLAVFIVDATATLIRRVLSGERWYEAHRSHAYQRAVQAGYSHRDVTVAVMGLNVLLALAAAGVWLVPVLLPAVLVVTVGLLVGAWHVLSRVVSARPCSTN